MGQITNPTAQRLFRAFMQFKKAEWHERSVAGCTISELRVLFAIKKGATPDGHTMKVSDISRRLHVTPPTVTQMMKGLEMKGLVARHIDPTDRRAVGLTLTEKGEMITQRAYDAFSTSFQGLIEYLGEEESNHLADLLFKVFQYYNEKAAVLHSSLWDGDQDI